MLRLRRTLQLAEAGARRQVGRNPPSRSPDRLLEFGEPVYRGRSHSAVVGSIAWRMTDGWRAQRACGKGPGCGGNRLARAA